MKLTPKHILLLGVLVTTAISVLYQPIVTVYEVHGDYYDIGNGEQVEGIDTDSLWDSGTMYVDGDQ